MHLECVAFTGCVMRVVADHQAATRQAISYVLLHALSACPHTVEYTHTHPMLCAGGVKKQVHFGENMIKDMTPPEDTRSVTHFPSARISRMFDGQSVTGTEHVARRQKATPRRSRTSRLSIGVNGYPYT